MPGGKKRTSGSQSRVFLGMLPKAALKEELEQVRGEQAKNRKEEEEEEKLEDLLYSGSGGFCMFPG